MVWTDGKNIKQELIDSITQNNVRIDSTIVKLRKENLDTDGKQQSNTKQSDLNKNDHEKVQNRKQHGESNTTKERFTHNCKNMLEKYVDPNNGVDIVVLQREFK